MTEATKARILIVDDKAEIRDLIKMTLALFNYQLKEAANGDDALCMIRDWRPDIVLLDVMMPGKDGLEVCKEVKLDAELSQTVIVMLTARGQQHDKLEGFGAGSDAYLIKPFSPILLIETIDSFLSPAP